MILDQFLSSDLGYDLKSKKYSNKYSNNGHPSVRAHLFYQAAPKHELIDIA
jgi:hypothetical protein